MRQTGQPHGQQQGIFRFHERAGRQARVSRERRRAYLDCLAAVLERARAVVVPIGRGTIISMKRILLFLPLLLAAQTLPPEADRQLAHDIFKEFIEIRSGYTTGATTPVAEAAARRLRAAGFPEADIYIGGPIPTKANLVVRYRGT